MRRKTIVALTILLVCHFVAATAYLLRFPAWRAPDEGAHFAYIQHLHQTGNLPIFYGKEKGTYEAHQPPLYYLTAPETERTELDGFAGCKVCLNLVGGVRCYCRFHVGSQVEN
jgi:hypothetical protein